MTIRQHAIARTPDRIHSLPMRALAVIGGSLLLWASAKVQVPFWPVPMTLQTLAVLALAGALGRNLGLAAVALYLAEGAMGLPVFAGVPQNGVGLAYMAGPTGGYLAGFVLAALIVGHFADKGALRRPLAAFAVMLAGLAAIYAPGLAWLAQFTGVEKALALGAAPFILGDLLKAAIAALGLFAARRLPARPGR